MNLTTTSVLIKKHIWTAIFLLVALGLIVLIYLIYFSKKNTLNSTLDPISFETLGFFGTSLDTSQIVFDDKKAPRKLPVYKYSSGASLINIQNELKNSLKLQEAVPKETKDVSRGQGILLADKTGIVQIYRDYFSYFKIASFAIQKINTTPNLDELKQKSTNFFSSFPHAIKPPFENTELSYSHDTDISYTDNNPFGASTVNIKSIEMLSGVIVYTPRNYTQTTFDGSGELLSASYRSYQVPQALEEYPIIDATSAKSLLASSAKLINANGPGLLFTGTDKSLSAINLQKAYLAYYLPSYQPETIHPVWVFEGESRIQDTPIKLIYAVPAIDQKYYKTP